MQNHNVAIRHASEADVSAVSSIHMTSRAASMPFLPPQKRTVTQVEEWVRDVLLKTCAIWVALKDKEVIGYAALRDGTTLEHLYLRPDIRRNGIGTLLLNTVKLNSNGRITLHVFQQNTGALEFYRHHGFIIVNSNDGEENMEHLPEFVLQWERSPAALDNPR